MAPRPAGSSPAAGGQYDLTLLLPRRTTGRGAPADSDSSDTLGEVGSAFYSGLCCTQRACLFRTSLRSRRNFFVLTHSPALSGRWPTGPKPFWPAFVMDNIGIDELPALGHTLEEFILSKNPKEAEGV